MGILERWTSNVADNLRESFRVIASSRTGGELRELTGVSIASAGVTFQMFNSAFLSGPVATEAELKKRILESIALSTRADWNGPTGSARTGSIRSRASARAVSSSTTDCAFPPNFPA